VNISAKPARFTLLFEILDIQVFNTDCCIVIHIPPREFVEEISPLVRDMVIDLLQSAFCFLPVPREPFFPAESHRDE
jgi:hypothetical protein